MGRVLHKVTQMHNGWSRTRIQVCLVLPRLRVFLSQSIRRYSALGLVLGEIKG